MCNPDLKSPGAPGNFYSDSVTVTLVNVSPSVARSVIVQGGAYGEHQIESVSDGKETMKVDAGNFPLRLLPGWQEPM